MKRVVLFAHLEVVPIASPRPGGQEGEVEEGKQFIFTDNEGGEIIMYPMADQFARKIGSKLRMSNKALVGELEAERRRAEAEATLGIQGNGGTPVPGEDEVVKDILGNVHIKGKGKEK